MNILLLVKNFDLGGTEVHVRELANQLSSFGHEVHIVSNRGRQIQLLNDRVRHHVLPFSEIKSPLRIYQLCKLVHRHKINIIHAHQRIAITHAAVVGKITDTPSIATVHGRLIYDIRSKLVRHLLSHIIAVAPNRLSSLSESSALLDKSSVVYNAVQQSASGSGVHRKRIISYVSRIDRKHAKVLKLLMTEAMPAISERCDNTELHIIGDGSNVEDLIQVRDTLPSKVKNRVVFHGYHANPQEVLSQSILCIGVGRVAIEALCVNTPVISANADHCGGLITLANYEEFKESNFVARKCSNYSSNLLTEQIIGFLKASPEPPLELYEKAKRDFSYANMTLLLEKTYQRLL